MRLCSVERDEATRVNSVSIIACISARVPRFDVTTAVAGVGVRLPLVISPPNCASGALPPETCRGSVSRICMTGPPPAYQNRRLFAHELWVHNMNSLPSSVKNRESMVVLLLSERTIYRIGQSHKRNSPNGLSLGWR